MDAELADMKEVVGRIDERTTTILANQGEMKEALEDHEDRDREDFKSINDRVTSVERKQNWILGVGTAIVAGISLFYKFLFGG